MIGNYNNNAVSRHSCPFWTDSQDRGKQEEEEGQSECNDTG